MNDITELQAGSYPKISLCLNVEDMTKAYLILTPNGNRSLHLIIEFADRYPLLPPKVTIQSKLFHPNIYGSYIYASILNTDEGYTPAYTLEGIAIQLLSFFSSDRVKQIETGIEIELSKYRNSSTRGLADLDFHRPKYNFNKPTEVNATNTKQFGLLGKDALLSKKKPLRRNRTGRGAAREQADRRLPACFEILLFCPRR